MIKIFKKNLLFVLIDQKFVFVFFYLFLFNVSFARIEVKNAANETVEIINYGELPFALPVPYHSINARLVLANPIHACNELTKPPNITHHDSYQWFVLAQRYTCTFQVKVGNAINAGYNGIIIYNHHELAHTSDLLTNSYHSPILIDKMDHEFNLNFASGASIPVMFDIPALIVSHNSGLTLANQYLYQTNHHLLIISDQEIDISSYLIPFAIIIGLGLLLITSYMVMHILRCISNHRRVRKYRLSKHHLKKVPITKYSKNDQFDTCAICLEDYVEGEKLRVLPCAHAYHIKCIDPWLINNRRVCPVCKAKVKIEGVNDYTDSEDDIEQNSVNERTPLLMAFHPHNLNRNSGSNLILSNQASSATNRFPNQVISASTFPNASRSRNLETVNSPSSSYSSISSSSNSSNSLWSNVKLSRILGRRSQNPLHIFNRIQQISQNVRHSNQNNQSSQIENHPSLVTNVETDITPITLAPQHSVNCDNDSSDSNLNDNLIYF